MPRGAYQNLIEGPARRLASSTRPLRIEPALTEHLLEEVDQSSGKDALPLLAFSLERLYLEYGGDGDLRLEEYNAMSGIRAAIEAAVEGVFQVAAKDPKLPRERKALETLLRRGLIPCRRHRP